jgi:hypothetical protein
MMKVLKILVPAMLAGLFAANAAHAKHSDAPPPPPPSWQEITASGFSFSAGGTPITYGATDSSGASVLASAIWYYNDNISNQSAANMQTEIQNLFSLSGSSLLSFVSQCDGKTGSGCIAATSSGSGVDYKFSSDKSFNYLAVHLGGGELAFQWKAPVTMFSISGESKLSNYRAYTNIAAVPEPETYAMMLAGLLGIVELRRRKLAA